MKEVVIVSGVRTAIGTLGSSLKDIPSVNLDSLVIEEVPTRLLRGRLPRAITL